MTVQRKKSSFSLNFPDNIDTRSVLDAVRDLIAASNVYLRDSKSPNRLLLRDIAYYLTKIFQMFGVIPSHSLIGFPTLQSDGANVNVRTHG